MSTNLAHMAESNSITNQRCREIDFEGHQVQDCSDQEAYGKIGLNGCMVRFADT